MKDWFSAAELVELGLPGLPGTERAIQLRASRESWPHRARAAKGGGREYPLAALPEEARLEYARLAAEEAGSYERPSEPVAPKRRAARSAPTVNAATLPEKTLALAEAKAAVVRALQAFRAVAGIPKERALLDFCAAYCAGYVQVAPWIREQVSRVSKNSLRDWEKTLAEHGLVGLVPSYGNRKGSGRIDQDGEIRSFILGLIAEKPHVQAITIHKGLKARFPEKDLPAERSIQRWVTAWKVDNAQLFEKVRDPDAWRSKYKAASGSRSEGIVRLNQVWELDSTPADLLLADGARHSLIGVIDVYTRRLRLLVSRTSCAAGVAATLRGAVVAWGVPEMVRIDNGSDYVSRHMRRAYDSLGIETHICPPFTPEAKPHIERSFRTFSHGLLELLPAFVGHNVAERKAIENRKSFAQRLMSKDEVVEVRMAAPQLQEFCDKWCADLYAHEPHGGLNGQTPFQVAAAWTAPVKRIENERALDVLLSPTDGDGWKTVTKKGIRADRASFDHAYLGGMEGQRVQVLFDDADYGYIYVFDDAGEFVCKAMCPERTGVSRAEVAATRKAHQTLANAEGMKMLKKAKAEARVVDVVPEILAMKAEAAGKLAQFPTPTQAYSTPALEQAARAARVLPEPPPARTAEDEAKRRALRDDLRVVPKVVDGRAEKRARVERGLDVEGRMEAGEPVHADDARWFETYRNHPEFKTAKEMMKDFGRLVV
ncbi:Mu transposase C-terminal domain-containing protein [Rhodospirillum sp. A1_3_36]|uniref:Mu transposase C-terminal domain-containing protein n=1 Tax=Rhodospirillum sp. A1_3_36 TaxID=3391666 RepID=UPI0039A4C44B